MSAPVRCLLGYFALVAFVGCGGGGDLSHDDFVDAANRICTAAGRQMAIVERDFAEATDDVDRQMLSLKAGDIATRRVADLLALNASDASDKAILAKLTEGRDLARKVATGQDPSVRSDLTTINGELRTAFDQAGVSACVAGS